MKKRRGGQKGEPKDAKRPPVRALSRRRAVPPAPSYAAPTGQWPLGTDSRGHRTVYYYGAEELAESALTVDSLMAYLQRVVHEARHG